jgi:hypothetical protein
MPITEREQRTLARRSSAASTIPAVLLPIALVSRTSSIIENWHEQSNNLSGAEGIRTPDPLHAMEVRYQLRYSPLIQNRSRKRPTETVIGNTHHTSRCHYRRRLNRQCAPNLR